MKTTPDFSTSIDANTPLYSESVNETILSLLSTEVAGVALTTVIVHFFLLAALLILGITANAAIIFAARSPTRAHHFWRRLVIGNLCVVQLIVCVIESPLGVTSSIAGFLHRPLPASLCSAGYSLLHGTLAATVTGFVFLAVVRWRELERTCSGEPQEVTGSKLVTACIVAGPWVVGALFAAISLIEYPGSVAFLVCRDSKFNEAIQVASTTWRIKPTLMVIYCVATTVCIVFLGASHRYHSNKLDLLFANWPGRCEKTTLLGVSMLPEDSNQDQRRMSKANTGPTVKLNALGFGSKRPTNLTVDGSINVNCGSPEEDEEVLDGGTEDTFDSKMRLKFQKKSRSSGRRHTVANIGLPDIGNKRRCSLENGKRKTSCSANDYLYVRKWSVDTMALANQLENPKSHAGSYPMLRNSSPGVEGSDVEMGNKATLIIGPEESTGSVHTTGLLHPVATKTVDSTPLCRQTEKKKSAEMCITLETPSIVVSLTPDTEADTLDDSFETRSGLDSEATRKKNCSPLDSADRSPNDKGLIAAREELSEVLRTIIGLLVSLVIVLPLTVFVLAELSLKGIYDLNVTLNLELILGVLCLALAIAIPVFLIWANRELREQLMLMKKLLMSLRCICYCNLGPGRSCPIRKRRRQKI